MSVQGTNGRRWEGGKKGPEKIPSFLSPLPFFLFCGPTISRGVFSLSRFPLARLHVGRLESSLGRSGTRQKAAFILHKAATNGGREEEEEGARRWVYRITLTELQGGTEFHPLTCQPSYARTGGQFKLDRLASDHIPRFQVPLC